MTELGILLVDQLGRAETLPIEMLPVKWTSQWLIMVIAITRCIRPRSLIAIGRRSSRVAGKSGDRPRNASKTTAWSSMSSRGNIELLKACETVLVVALLPKRITKILTRGLLSWWKPSKTWARTILQHKACLVWNVRLSLSSTCGLSPSYPNSTWWTHGQISAISCTCLMTRFSHQQGQAPKFRKSDHTAYKNNENWMSEL